MPSSVNNTNLDPSFCPNGGCDQEGIKVIGFVVPPPTGHSERNDGSWAWIKFEAKIYWLLMHLLIDCSCKVQSLERPSHLCFHFGLIKETPAVEAAVSPYLWFLLHEFIMEACRSTPHFMYCNKMIPSVLNTQAFLRNCNTKFILAVFKFESKLSFERTTKCLWAC